MDTDLSYGIDPSAIQDPYSNCNDPFGGMGGFEDGGFGGQETCERCRMRNEGICLSGVGRDIGYGTLVAVALIGCLAAGVLAEVCVIIGALFIATGTAIYAYYNYRICIDQIINKCPQCSR